MVDSFTERDPTEWAILTAHYGVVLANLEAALNTCTSAAPSTSSSSTPASTS